MERVIQLVLACVLLFQYYGSVPCVSKRWVVLSFIGLCSFVVGLTFMGIGLSDEII